MESITSSAGDSVVELQRAVQRKLGRCMLRLQQCEILLKKLVAVADVAGPPEELQGIQAKQAADVHKNTMGTLVDAFTNGLLARSRESDVSSKGTTGTGGTWIGFRLQIVLGPEKFDVVRSALNELVVLRNELVHHFLERFNIWDAEGCTAAEAHLDFSFEVIDAHCSTLLGWAKSIDGERERIAALMPTFFGELLDDVRPDGSVDWQNCGAVSSLRESESRFAISGWTKLNIATAWIREQYPDEKPQRYGCNSWRHVIHESRQFEVRKQSNNGDGRNEVWFRSQPTKTKE